MKKVCVLGLGYIGLPTASMLANNGYEVYGVDISPKVVDIINNGDIHIEEPGLKTLVKAAINSGNLKAYLTPQEADIFIIAVPTPIDENKKSDLSYIKSAAESIVNKLKSGNLVILESTSPPGTTRDFLVPILEKSGLKIGKELFIAYCPERVLPGKTINELIQNTRIIGGINQTSAQQAREIYISFAEGDIHLTDATTAEMVKIMENTYRDVNIALANELAQISHNIGVNAWEVIKLANLHPRVRIHNPSPGVGGHCISVDPWFIVEKVSTLAKLINQSRNINDSMPEFTYDLLLRQVKDISNAKITILGITYKANIDDIRESPAVKIIEMINNNPNLRLSIYDPHVKYFDYELSGFEEAFKNSDCILLTVDHAEFKYLDPEQIAKIVRNKIIIDTRNALNRQKWEENGFKYILLGEG
ncbi:MAG: UDP-N-acetyl-D-mannosamine dehydrogenase [Candidatus Melainabacteria bacterium RIFOXYA2_FULL_32_9]|nr:MAG: UDP-N-acetyl-D-mannosamine dehydrogenase [Candidatus Melainabacteria bacterium RIFOXYA2_FULL_32_9]